MSFHRPSKYPPIRPLTPAEQQTVLTHLGLVRLAASRVALAIVANRIIPGVGRNFHTQMLQVYDEVYSAGLEGLCVAAQRFDADRLSKRDDGKTVKFSTFAFHWIRSAIGQHSRAVEFRYGPWSKAFNAGTRRVRLFSETANTSNDGGEMSHNDNGCADPRLSEDTDEAEHRRHLMLLLNLVLDGRKRRIVEQVILNGRTNADVGEEEGVSKQRISQQLADALHDLRQNSGFMRALIACYQRRKSEMRMHETIGGGMFVA